MRIRLTAILAMAGVLLAAGCAQSSKDRYIDDFEPLNERLVRVNDELVDTINTASAGSSGRFATELRPLSGELTRLSRQIGRLDTPEDLREESAALTRSLDETGAGANRTAILARRADRRALADATVRLAKDANRLIRDNRRLARATGAAG